MLQKYFLVQNDSWKWVATIMSPLQPMFPYPLYLPHFRLIAWMYLQNGEITDITAARDWMKRTAEHLYDKENLNK